MFSELLRFFSFADRTVAFFCFQIFASTLRGHVKKMFSSIYYSCLWRYSVIAVDVNFSTVARIHLQNLLRVGGHDESHPFITFVLFEKKLQQ